MIYEFDRSSLDISERILKINNLSKEDIDVSSFLVDDKLDLLDSFKTFLLNNSNLSYLIVGDFDCDGICATTIIKKLLDDLNIKVNYYIPSRSKEGYGINSRIVEMAHDNNFDVIIMVDNGVKANDQIKLAKEYGIKTIVIDHHEYSDKLDCDLFFHPNLFEKKYADMCAGGLSALLANYIRDDDLTTVLGGLATLADMVSVLNYNRYLIKKMYHILENKDIYPIKYLLGSNELSYTSLQFNVIPKINAISRLDKILNVNYMVKYLLFDKDECAANLNKIEMVNETRKQLSKQMYEKAIKLIDDSKDIIVVSDESFLEGLCGLLANKFLNIFNKPVIVLTKLENEYKGSGRALSNNNIYEYFDGFKDKFKTYGGHAQAVGMSFELDKMDEFLEYINTHSIKHIEHKENVLLLKQDEINFDTYKKIEELRPFGCDFKEPKLAIENLKYDKKICIAKKYPKFLVNDIFDAVSFSEKLLNVEFDTMIGHLDKDNYHTNKLSFLIEDLI